MIRSKILFFVFCVIYLIFLFLDIELIKYHSSKEMFVLFLITFGGNICICFVPKKLILKVIIWIFVNFGLIFFLFIEQLYYKQFDIPTVITNSFIFNQFIGCLLIPNWMIPFLHKLSLGFKKYNTWNRIWNMDKIQ